MYQGNELNLVHSIPFVEVPFSSTHVPSERAKTYRIVSQNLLLNTAVGINALFTVTLLTHSQTHVKREV